MTTGAALIATLGWSATAIFVASYFFKRAERLRAAQMLGAAVWIMYGVAIRAAPVIAANVLVLGAAGWASHRDRRSGTPRDR